MERLTRVAAALGAALMLAAPAEAQISTPGAREASQASFSALDANQDGKLTAEEMLAPRRAMWARGAGGASMTLQDCLRVHNELLSQGGGGAEAQLSESFAGECKRMDKNNDGVLSWEEFAGSAWLTFKLMDSDGDGVVTLDEFAGQGLQALRRLPPPPQLSPGVKAELDAAIAKAQAGRAASPGSAGAPALPAPQAPGVASAAQGQAQPQSGGAPARGADSVYERVQGWFR